MRKTLKVFPIVAALALGALPAYGDEALLQALQNAGISLSAEMAAKVETSSEADVAPVMAELIAGLGDGNQVQVAIAAAVTSFPDEAGTIVGAAVAATPALAAAITSAAVGAAPTKAGPITAAAVTAAPTQAEAIVAAAISAAPSQSAAIQAAAETALIDTQAEENEELAPPSPN